MVEVSRCRKKERREILYGGGIEHRVAYGDEGDFGTRVKREDVTAEPADCDGAVGGESREVRV